MYNITKKIGIDAGHRLPSHGSKCRHIHGHHYTIEATCHGGLYKAGEQEGMVLDFGFLKEEMMECIDIPCDHGFIVAANDDLVLQMFWKETDPTPYVKEAEEKGFWSGNTGDGMKLYIVPFAPTAENLAKHWYERLDPRIKKRSNGEASLHQVTVWETPTSSAVYAIDI